MAQQTMKMINIKRSMHIVLKTGKLNTHMDFFFWNWWEKKFLLCAPLYIVVIVQLTIIHISNLFRNFCITVSVTLNYTLLVDVCERGKDLFMWCHNSLFHYFMCMLNSIFLFNINSNSSILVLDYITLRSVFNRFYVYHFQFSFFQFYVSHNM